jgi:hypothetical protein
MNSMIAICATPIAISTGIDILPLAVAVTAIVRIIR